MMPMPTPAPMSAIEARPAPIIFADARSIVRKLLIDDMRKTGPAPSSMMFVQIQGVVEIDTGEDGKHIVLQEGDEEFERGDRNDREERHNRNQRQHATRGGKADDESPEHIEHRVARQHVGEKTYRQADRTAQEGHDLDRN